jgi:hypothetical protein
MGAGVHPLWRQQLCHADWLSTARPARWSSMSLHRRGKALPQTSPLQSAIKDKFDRAKFSSIIFDAASGPAQVTPASPEPYFQTQLTATFEAYLD